jgi:hypothetical protein
MQWVIMPLKRVSLDVLNDSSIFQVIANDMFVIFRCHIGCRLISANAQIRLVASDLNCPIIAPNEVESVGAYLQIDALVYELYGLTEEEIKLVERG